LLLLLLLLLLLFLLLLLLLMLNLLGLSWRRRGTGLLVGLLGLWEVMRWWQLRWSLVLLEMPWDESQGLLNNVVGRRCSYTHPIGWAHALRGGTRQPLLGLRLDAWGGSDQVGMLKGCLFLLRSMLRTLRLLLRQRSPGRLLLLLLLLLLLMLLMLLRVLL